MVRETFYRNLSLARKKLKLKSQLVKDTGVIRMYDRKGNRYCPVTAVAALKTGYCYAEYNAALAGQQMGLSKGLVSAIVEAADHHDPTNGIRLTLMRRLGLKK